MKSKDVMSGNVITINASETMVNAYKRMHERSIRHLPVVDERGAVVGILSDRDIQLALNVRKVEDFQTISMDSNLIVEDFMSWPVYVVSEETSLRRVAEEMLAQKVSAFIVQDNVVHMKVIVTTDDLIKLFLIDTPFRPETTLKSLTRHFFTPATA